jgi:hypothetical protein
LLISTVTKLGDWIGVKIACLNTIGKTKTTKEPSELWKKNLLLSEHSPIRRLKYIWTWTDLPYWVSVHITRHKFGIDHWVSTQREDRTGEDRDSKRQDEPVIHTVEGNAQALINVSRKRLCFQASTPTREAWEKAKVEVGKVDNVMASVMVKECVYRGFCPELTSCGYADSHAYILELQEYRSGINGY